MKFFLIALVFISSAAAYAVEEVLLEPDDRSAVMQELQERDSDFFKSSYLFEEVLTKHFQKSPVESVHFFGYYRAGNVLDINSDDEDLTYDFYAINAGVNGNFRDGNTYYEARFRFNPQDDYTFFQYLPSNLYIANTSIPHHTLILGNTRTPTGYEGGMSYTNIPFAARSQISRNLGNIRKLGFKVKGNYDYFDYDLGGYSSDTYFRKFFPGAEFSGWGTLKPFGKNTKYGKLKLGGGITAGRNETDYFVSGAYAGYEYKNFTADFEWAHADGYNGAKGISTNQAEGFYTTLGYKITPKVQAVARYDQFTPNLAKHADIRREYSAGINYFIKGQALKLMLNYVFCQNDILKDSHRIILGTQILF